MADDVTQKCTYKIRCLYIDYGRPSEDGAETHWRCPVRFRFDPSDPDTFRQVHCQDHQVQQGGASPKKEAIEAMQRFERAVTVPASVRRACADEDEG